MARQGARWLPSPAETRGVPVAERLIVLPPMLQQRGHIMTPAEIEGRRVIALRLFDALCAQYPDKYIYLISAVRPSGRRDRGKPARRLWRGSVGSRLKGGSRD